jgi:primase-polymerase (primpol)-like protein
MPYNPLSNARARTNDPATWNTLEAASSAAARQGHDGVGFMLSPDDPFVGIDLDHCYDPTTGTLAPWAEAIVRDLDSYTEVTPSGTGLRIFVRGQLPPREQGRKRGPIEMYDDRRFLTVTGQHLRGTPTSIEDRTATIGDLHARVFQSPPAPPPTAPVGEPSMHDLSDASVLTKIQGAQNHEAFTRLWSGDTTGYASDSEADLALCGMLAFYTQDPAQIERLVARSELWDEKWQNRPAYRQGTIQTAIARRTGTYSGQRPPPRTPGSGKNAAPTAIRGQATANVVAAVDSEDAVETPLNSTEAKDEQP